MRSVTLLVVITIGLPLLVASCDGTSEPQASGTGTMAALIDGTPWQGELSESGSYHTAEQNLYVNYHEPDAVTPNTHRTITLSLRPVSGVGTVALGRMPDSSYATLHVHSYPDGHWRLDQYFTLDSAGWATITEFNLTTGQFAGTFAFVAVAGSDTVHVTDGTWTAELDVVN